LQNLEDLQLSLHFLKHSRWQHLLCSICFDRLNLLYSNAPHDVISQFLWSHPRITFLHIEQCVKARRPCHLDGGQLPELYEVSASVGCVMSLMKNNPVSHVTAQQGALLIITALMSPLALTTTNLTVPELDMNPSDFNALGCIIWVAPTLMALKLLETQSFKSRHSHQRRAWKDGKSWGKTLHSLAHLQHFALWTSL
ncbi:hypothetical protein V8B97DRAFT_2086028, partial [Scleroderma yunnanense]